MQTLRTGRWTRRGIGGKGKREIGNSVCTHCTVEDRQLAGKPLRGSKLCSVALRWPRRVGWQGRMENICIHIAVQQQPMQCCNYIPKRKSNVEKKKNFMRTFSAAKTKESNLSPRLLLPNFKNSDESNLLLNLSSPRLFSLNSLHQVDLEEKNNEEN